MTPSPSPAITQTLCKNLQSLGTYAAAVSGNIDKVPSKFNKNSQLIARGEIVYDPVGILFEAYLVLPCHHFKSYIHCQHEDYLDDGKLTTITHKALMTSAKRKFDWLKTKGFWGAESPDKKKKKGNNKGKRKKNKKNTYNCQKDQKKKPQKAVANSATFAPPIATEVNPKFATLMASIANLD